MAPSDTHGRSGHGRVPDAPDPLPIAVVDNHTHLDIARDGEAPPDVAAAVAAATAVGVDRLVQIGCDLPGARFTVDVVDRHPQVLGGVAIHPNEAPRLAAAGALDAAYREIEALAAHPRIRVIGETGLDYFRTGPEGVGVQQDSFRWHIDLAKRTGRALQIHDRDAHEDVLRILEEEGAPDRTVMHCFSGDMSVARACVERGYHLSFAGTVTFKNAKGLRDALSIVPLDRLLVETDAPYLTPAPWRGATNAPYLVPLTVRAMAGVVGVAVPTLCEALSANSEAVYGPW
ncbi:TatD family hydrolase [Phycicoccus ginsengisoli]